MNKPEVNVAPLSIACLSFLTNSQEANWSLNSINTKVSVFKWVVHVISLMGNVEGVAHDEIKTFLDWIFQNS
jgi:hypothetical protein